MTKYMATTQYTHTGKMKGGHEGKGLTSKEPKETNGFGFRGWVSTRNGNQRAVIGLCGIRRDM